MFKYVALTSRLNISFIATTCAARDLGIGNLYEDLIFAGLALTITKSPRPETYIVLCCTVCKGKTIYLPNEVRLEYNLT